MELYHAALMRTNQELSRLVGYFAHRVERRMEPDGNRSLAAASVNGRDGPHVSSLPRELIARSCGPRRPARTQSVMMAVRQAVDAGPCSHGTMASAKGPRKRS